MSLSVIIAAGGVGNRMGLGRSKQLMELAGQPVLARTAALFDGSPLVDEIVIAIEAADVERCRAGVVEAYHLNKVSGVVPGGANRAESVKNALAAVADSADTVLVHDGARPLFPIGLLEPALDELGSGKVDGIVFGVPVQDTIKEVDAGRLVVRTPERSRTWAAQTPQIFHRSTLEQAYRMPAEVLAQAKDDSMLVEIAGGRVKMMMGDEQNIKLTTPVDLLVAEQILRERGKDER